MTVRSETIRGLSIPSVEETVDQAMVYLPTDFDLSKPGSRQVLRNWMVRICRAVVTKNADSMVKVAESAIQEAAALAIDPDYYASVKKSRERRKAQHAMIRTRQKSKSQAEIKFERLTSSTTKM